MKTEEKAMSLRGLVLDVINVAIVAAILVLVGAIIVMLAKWFTYTIDWNVQRLYLLVVLLIVLYLIVALLFGLPGLRIIGHHSQSNFPAVGAALPPAPNIMREN
jgi:phosphoglycerol transferase MdoB-like AlkP superfamily enzyme